MKDTNLSSREDALRLMEERIYKKYRKMTRELLTIRAAIDLLPMLGLEEEEE